jgi:hypothetical protein
VRLHEIRIESTKDYIKQNKISDQGLGIIDCQKQMIDKEGQ